jgi:hypothetical protein
MELEKQVFSSIAKMEVNLQDNSEFTSSAMSASAG